MDCCSTTMYDLRETRFRAVEGAMIYMPLSAAVRGVHDSLGGLYEHVLEALFGG